MGLPYHLTWHQLGDDGRTWSPRSGTTWSLAPGHHTGLKGTKFWVLPHDQPDQPLIVGEPGRRVKERLEPPGGLVCLTGTADLEAARRAFFGRSTAPTSQAFTPKPFEVDGVPVSVEDRGLYWRWEWDRMAPPWFDMGVHRVELSKRPRPHLSHWRERGFEADLVADLPTPDTATEAQAMVRDMIATGADVRAANRRDRLDGRPIGIHLPRCTDLTCNCGPCRSGTSEYEVLHGTDLAELVAHRQARDPEADPHQVALAAILPYYGQAHLDWAATRAAGRDDIAGGYLDWLLDMDQLLHAHLDRPFDQIGALRGALASAAREAYLDGPDPDPAVITEKRAAIGRSLQAVAGGDFGALERLPTAPRSAPPPRRPSAAVGAGGRRRRR